MALSKPQIIFMQQARRQVGDQVLDDAPWRMLLHNAVGMTSLRDGAWTQADFEDVMAVLEEMGFRDRNDSTGTKWRDKVARRGTTANERVVRKIIAMSQQCTYPLSALCRRVSDGRTTFAEKLTPKEAWNLIEAMKQMNARELTRSGSGDYARELPVASDQSPAVPARGASRNDRLFDESAAIPVVHRPTPAAVPVEVMDDLNDIPF